MVGLMGPLRMEASRRFSTLIWRRVASVARGTRRLADWEVGFTSLPPPADCVCPSAGLAGLFPAPDTPTAAALPERSNAANRQAVAARAFIVMRRGGTGYQLCSLLGMASGSFSVWSSV